MKKLLSLLLCLALAAGVAPSALAAERPEGVPSAGAYETETESESGTDEYAVSALTLDGNSVRFNDFGRYVHDSRYASRKVLKGIDVSAAADLGSFADFESVSVYARTAIAWASAEGIINGSADGRLMPKAGATRAQVAAILHRYIENCIF